MHLAEKSVLLVAARVLWAFDIVPAKDVQGNDIQISADPATAYEHTVIASPKPFPVKFVPRSSLRQNAIREMYQDAEALWADLKLDLYS